MLPISRFHAVPVWSRDKNQNFRAGRQGAQSARRMEGRRLERCAGRLHQSLHLAPQILNVLFEGHAGCDLAWCAWARNVLTRDTVSRGGLNRRAWHWRWIRSLRFMGGTGVRDPSRGPRGGNLSGSRSGRRCSRALTAAIRWLSSLPGRFEQTLLFRFGCLLLHYLDGVEVIFDVLVFTPFHRAVRSVHRVAEIFDEDRIDTQHSVLVTLRLKHVAHSQRSDVSGIFKVSRVESLQSDFIENLAAFGPGRKCVARISGLGSPDVLVFVIFLGAPDDAVFGDVSYDLLYFRFGERDVHDQSLTVGKLVLLAGLKERRDGGQHEGRDDKQPGYTRPMQLAIEFLHFFQNYQE